MTSQTNEDQGPIDKDGGFGDTEVDTAIIEVALNGFFLTFVLLDGSQEKTVHESLDDVLSAIRSRY